MRLNRLQTAIPAPSDPDSNGASIVQELLGGRFGEMPTFTDHLPEQPPGNERKRTIQMAKQTKADRSAAAKKGAATRKKNEAKSTGKDAKAAAKGTAKAAKGAAESAAGTVKKAAQAASKRMS